VAEFDTVIWEGSEEDGGDQLRLLCSSQLDIVALQRRQPRRPGPP
jgi:hypothetical protein